MRSARLLQKYRHLSGSTLGAVRIVVALVLVLAGSFFLFASQDQATAQSGAPLVRVIDLDATINVVSARYLKRSLDNANGGGVELVVIELDTPGGSLDSTRDMVAEILASEVPVIVFVAPEGAQAASAGTFISAASGLLAMAPATNIGAASPVDSSGNDLPDTLANKVTQSTASYLRSIADERGRNSNALEETVLNAASYSANEAVELNIADLIARNLDDLLTQVNGRTIPTFEDEITVRTVGARIERVDMNYVDRFVSFIANPNIAFLLISLGTIGLIVELWSPGLWIPGTLGVAFMVLGWVGVGNLDFSWAGVIFLVLAILLFVLESQADGISYFGIAGGIALIIGGVFLVGRFTDPNLPQGTQTVSLWLLAIIGGSAIGFVVWLSWQIRLASRVPQWVSGGATTTLVGKEALVTDTLDPAGEVHVGGEFWSAQLANVEFATPGTSVAEGAKVRVVRVEGMHLFVEPLNAPAQGSQPKQGDDSAAASV